MSTESALFKMPSLSSKNAVHIAAIAIAAGLGAQQVFALNDGVAKLPGNYL